MMTKYQRIFFIQQHGSFINLFFFSHSGHIVLLTYKIQQIVSFFLFLFILMGIVMCILRKYTCYLEH